MSGKILDFIPQRLDNFKVLPKIEWQIMRIVRAKRRIKIVRWCAPNCEFFKEDWDGKGLCFDSCNFWIFDKHYVEPGDTLFDLLFAVNTENPHEGFSTFVGEDYLRNLLGQRWVNKLINQYEKTFPVDQTYVIEMDTPNNTKKD